MSKFWSRFAVIDWHAVNLLESFLVTTFHYQ
jgi:hypothetical protein